MSRTVLPYRGAIPSGMTAAGMLAKVVIPLTSEERRFLADSIQKYVD